MSQARLAELVYERHGIRMDPTAITRMEKNTRMVRLNEAVALAEVLGLRLFDLIQPPSLAGVGEDEASEIVRQLAADLEKLDAELAEARQGALAARDHADELQRRRTALADEIRALLTFIDEIGKLGPDGRQQ